METIELTHLPDKCPKCDGSLEHVWHNEWRCKKCGARIIIINRVNHEELSPEAQELYQAIKELLDEAIEEAEARGFTPGQARAMVREVIQQQIEELIKEWDAEIGGIS